MAMTLEGHIRGRSDKEVERLLITLDAAQADGSAARAALSNLVAEVAQECAARADERGPATRLAEGNEVPCGKPARWGILTAWTCDEHRRVDPSPGRVYGDLKEVGGPALLAAMSFLSAPAPACTADTTLRDE